MNTDTKTLLLAAVLGASVPMAAIAGDDYKDKSAMEKTGDYISDAAMTTKVKAALVAEDDLSALDINVETDRGVVTLSGMVDNDAQAELAEQKVEELDGVKGVNNKLVASD